MARRIKLMDSDKAHSMQLELADRMDFHNESARMGTAMGLPAYSKVVQKELNKAAKTSGSGTKATHGFFKPDVNDTSGRGLWTLTHAALVVLGAMDNARTAFNPLIWAAFYRSNTAVRYHTKAGHVERLEGGKARLTVAGFNYLYGRLSGQTPDQQIYQKEIDTFIAAIKTGNPEGYAKRHNWVAF